MIGGSKGKINPLSKVTRAEMAVMLYRATHLTVQSSGAVYQSRGDLVNLCIGTQNYCDVVIENYDPSVTYTGLMLSLIHILCSPQFAVQVTAPSAR